MIDEKIDEKTHEVSTFKVLSRGAGESSGLSKVYLPFISMTEERVRVGPVAVQLFMFIAEIVET